MGKQDTLYRPCDTRYRSRDYFLEDQLKESQAVDDFRAVKSLLDSSLNFSPANFFSFKSAKS